MYSTKVYDRLITWAKDSSFDLEKPWILNGKMLPSLDAISKKIAGVIRHATWPHAQIIHGDLCFSNVLYDSRNECIRIIDPRGELWDGSLSIYGDPRYDLAKLHHSIFGMYDFAIAGQIRAQRLAPYSLNLPIADSKTSKIVKVLFSDMLNRVAPGSATVVSAISCSLFLSMLPLHNDDKERQVTLLAIGLQIFLENGGFE